MTNIADATSPAGPAQVTHPYVRTPEDPDATAWYLAHRFTYLAEASDTAGTLTVIDALVRHGFEPPPHTHSRDDEAFLLIDGAARFRSGDTWMDAHPGSFVWLPRHVEHEFSLQTDSARMVIIMTPGGLERGLRSLSRPALTAGLPPAPDGPPTPEEIATLVAAMSECGVAFAPPPG